MKGLKIESLCLGVIGTNVYIVSNENTGECVIIDAADRPADIGRFIEERKLIPKAVLTTHGHFDHILAAEAIRVRYNIPVCIGEKDAYRLEHPGGFGRTFPGHEVREYTVLHDRDSLQLIGFTWQVICTPGHSEGAVCYYVEEEKVLFSGDTLFAGTYGRTDLEDGNFDKIKDSIYHRLFVLPDDTGVYPGHGGATEIGLEKKMNEILTD